MNKEDLFETCLEEMEKGRSPDDVCGTLQVHSYQAEFIELLQTVEDLRRFGEAVPPRSPALAASGRARLLAEAAKYRNRQSRGWWFPGIMLSLHKLRWSMTVMLLVAIFFVTAAGHFVVGAAAHSLPGDPLYPVKQLEERVTLALTLDATKRAALEQAIREERLREAREVAKKRQVTMRLQGVVRELSSAGFVLGNVPISITLETRVEGNLEAGAYVLVTVHTDGKGHLLADEIVVKRVALAAMHTIAPSPTATPTSTKTPVPPTVPPAPTNTALPVLVPVRSTPAPTSSPTATATSTVTPTLTATNTVTPTATATSTLTPTPPRVIWVTFSGVLYSATGPVWKIGKWDVAVTDRTEVQRSQGASLETGEWAIVEAAKRPDGTWIARKIVVTKSPRAVQINLQGEILSISGDLWNVGGTTLLVPASVTIHGTPSVGALALVSAVRQPDGTIVAREVTIRTREEVTFEGVVTSISSDQWVVGGIIVKITPSTRIDGTPREGARAQVAGWQNPDGSVDALQIIMLPEPTPAPSSTPTSQLKPKPSITPASLATATATEAALTATPTEVGTPTPASEDTGSPFPTSEEPQDDGKGQPLPQPSVEEARDK